MNSSKLFGRRSVLQISGAGVASVLFMTLRDTRATAAEPINVNIVNTSPNSAFTIQQLIKEKRWLEDFGLEPQTLNVSDGSKLMGALLSGSSDVCLLSGFGQVLPAIEKGGALKLVGGAQLLIRTHCYQKIRTSSRPRISRAVRSAPGPSARFSIS